MGIIERIRRYFQLVGKEGGIYIKVNPGIHEYDPGFAIIEQSMQDLIRETSKLQAINKRLEMQNARLAMENENLVNTINELNARLSTMGGSKIDIGKRRKSKEKLQDEDDDDDEDDD